MGLYKEMKQKLVTTQRSMERYVRIHQKKLQDQHMNCEGYGGEELLRWKNEKLLTSFCLAFLCCDWCWMGAAIFVSADCKFITFFIDNVHYLTQLIVILIHNYYY